MGKKDPRVDAYIAKAAGFAKPILEEIRARVHAACPDVEETMKWSVPAFEYKGPFCGMAAFKKHCVFGFWKSPLVLGESGPDDNPMGFRDKLTSLEDLPPKSEFRANMKKAMDLNDQRHQGAAREAGAEARDRGSRRLRGRGEEEQEGPGRLRRLQPEPSPRIPRMDHRGEDRGDAKPAVTQAIEWMAEGKPRNWKYM